MKGIVPAAVLLMSVLSACGKSEAPVTEPENSANTQQAASEGPRPKEATNVPLDRYVVVGDPDSDPAQGFDLIAFNAAISQIDPAMPPDFDLLASLSSKDYERTQDAFKKRELLAQLQPKLEERMAYFQANPYIATVYIYKNNIEGYDFSRNAFPVNVFKATRALFAGNGLLEHYTLKNEAAVAFFPVSDQELAKRIETLRTGEKPPRLKVYFASATKPKDPNNTAFNHYLTDEIPLTVTHMQLVDRDGTVLADYAPDQSDSPEASSDVQANAASIANDI
jgi:hypothetical protein